jgi:hypothetical protein
MNARQVRQRSIPDTFCRSGEVPAGPFRSRGPVPEGNRAWSAGYRFA